VIKVGLLDYKVGNLRSLYNAFRKVGTDCRIINSNKDVKDVDLIVLPGVGAFGGAVENISPYLDTIFNSLSEGTFLFGVCLGLQLLFERSEESPYTDGLKIFNGDVVKFSSNIKIPLIGWLQIEKIKEDSELLEDIKTGDYFYFVHSYYAIPKDKSIIAAVGDYNVKFPAVIEHKNIIATQFHPEKSSKNGLKLLSNLIKILKNGDE